MMPGTCSKHLGLSVSHCGDCDNANARQEARRMQEVRRMIAPKGTNAGSCRTCNAAVLWCRTLKGSAMPLDMEPVADGNIELRAQSPSGNVLAVVVTERSAGLFGEPGRYVSHFATCPDAKQHRKPKEA